MYVYACVWRGFAHPQQEQSNVILLCGPCRLLESSYGEYEVMAFEKIEKDDWKTNDRGQFVVFRLTLRALPVGDAHIDIGQCLDKLLLFFHFPLVCSLTLNARAIYRLCTHGCCKQHQMNLISLLVRWRHLSPFLGAAELIMALSFSHNVCDVNYQSAEPSFLFSWLVYHLALFINLILFYFCTQGQIKNFPGVQ